MKFELGRQVLLLVGMAHREVVITGRAQYLRGADQYLVEDLDPDSQRGAFWVEEPGLIGKDAATDAGDRRAERDARVARPRVDFSNAERDWTPPATAVPTSRGFYIGDRVIHPHYGGGIVTANVNGHTEVRFYNEDVRTHFTGVTADELKLASLREAVDAFPSEAALIEKAVREAVADGACAGLGKAVDRILKEQRAATATSEDAADADAASLSLVGDRIFGELARFDDWVERALMVFADRGYSANLSFHKPDPTPEVAPTVDKG